jgi:hypothetical protein
MGAVRWRLFSARLRLSRWLMPADHFHALLYGAQSRAWGRQLKEAGIVPVDVPYPAEYVARLTP